MLDFPTPKNKVAQIVWNHYLNIGKVRLSPPEESGKIEVVKYVKEQGKYGAVSMRKVVEEVTAPEKKYITCDFGKLIYKQDSGFLSKLENLSAKEKSVILDLPWPLTPAYYEADETMERIIKKLFEGFSQRSTRFSFSHETD